MSEFINTADVIGDDEMCDQIIQRTVTEYKENRITKVGQYAFYGCNQLETVDLPNATTVGQSAFNGCASLVELDVPNATNIGDGAFDYCSSLINVIIPSVETINYSGFRRCYKLECVDTSSLIKISGGYVFNCDRTGKLTALILRANTVCIIDGKDNFYGTPIASGTGYIYVPSAMVESYKSATGWAALGDQFRALEDYTVDGTITGELDETKI